MTMPASTETVAHPHLQQLLAEVAGVTAAVEEMQRTLTDAQCVWKPEPGVWNVLECIQHLIISGELYYPKIQGILDQAERRRGDEPFRPSFFGKTFIRYVSPESTRKIKTFRPFEPPPALTDRAVLDRFIEQQDTFAALIRQADGMHLNGNKFSSPVSRLVRFSLGEGLTMLAAHQRRHLQQARRLTEHPDFPE